MEEDKTTSSGASPPAPPPSPVDEPAGTGRTYCLTSQARHTISRDVSTKIAGNCSLNSFGRDNECNSAEGQGSSARAGQETRQNAAEAEKRKQQEKPSFHFPLGDWSSYYAQVPFQGTPYAGGPSAPFYDPRVMGPAPPVSPCWPLWQIFRPILRSCNGISMPFRQNDMLALCYKDAS